MKQKPTRKIPYGRQSVDEDDIAAVVEVLRSDWLTTGPKVTEFEQALAAACETKHAVAVSNGTAALHAAMFALEIGHGDEVIVPAITFASSANCAAFLGGRPVFADVDPDTLLLDPAKAAAKITDATKAIVAVDLAGQACDYDALREIAGRRGLPIVSDCCHALGGGYKGRPAGAWGTLNTHSFHPVKHITSGEGGAITTDDERLAERMRMFRNHGITTDFRQREQAGGWFYEMVELGFNYRLSDMQCALAMSQLKKLPGWIKRRQAIARRYGEAFASLAGVEPLAVRDAVSHAYHLYVIRVDAAAAGIDRAAAFKALRGRGVGVNVHYIPVHLHPYYRRTFGTGPGDCPVAEAAYEKILSLPMFPSMADDDVDYVVEAVREVLGGSGK